MYFIYRFKDKNDAIIYVGKSKALKVRMKQHFERDGHLTEVDYKEVHKVECVRFENRIDMDIMELYFINKWSPKLNTSGNYNESTNLLIEDDWEWVDLLNKKQIRNLIKNKKTKTDRILFSGEMLDEKLKSLSQFMNEKELINAVDSFVDKNNVFLNKTDFKMIEVLLMHSKRIVGVAFVSKRELAEELGRVRETMIRICNKLEGMGLITQVKMVGELKGGQAANAIVFIKIDE